MLLTQDFLEQHKADLGRRMAQLRQQRDQINASIWGTEGAIRNCDFLLEQLAKPDAKPEPAPTYEPTPH